MKLDELYDEIAGNYGKVCTLYLKNGSALESRILHGTRADDWGNIYLVVSEGKSQCSILSTEIERILI